MRVKSLILTEACYPLVLSAVVSAAAWTYVGNTIGNEREEPLYAWSTSGAILPVDRSEPLVDPKAKDWIRFQALAAAWKKARGVRSSVTEIVSLAPYQKIIGMGEAAIPFILSTLRSEGDNPDLWFWALNAITDENPVRPEDQGNFKLMANAWIEWGEREGYARNVAAA